MPQSLARNHGRRHRDVDGALALDHRDDDSLIRPLMHVVGYTGAFTAKQQDVIRAIGDFRIRHRSFGGGENKTATGCCPPFLEAVPADMPGQGGSRNIVHAGPFQIAIRNVETCWLDDIDAETEAGGQPQDGSGIAGNIGLVEGDPDCLHGLLIHVSWANPDGAAARKPDGEIGACMRLHFFKAGGWRFVFFCDKRAASSTPAKGGFHAK
ncbi:hypothetical protein AT6N2_C3409 [Agrobacterium tumefaciens]|nr:hypothetical protein AT6N2_C3409 [Agrobacterium tumefaciens]